VLSKENYDGQRKTSPINMALLPMADIIGVAAYGGWHEIRHAIIQ